MFTPSSPGTGKIYRDLTGKFPYMSSRGNQYLLIVYDYDSNAILQHPLRNKSGKDIMEGYMTIIQSLTAKGLKPRLQTMANKASTALQQNPTSLNINFQLVPPQVHRRNAVERAIQTFKKSLHRRTKQRRSKIPYGIMG
mmetsp:Transcript_8669/g.12595  ORF Transcript_8669/g.12595 Transcript_8669/m.12595 type:complete len:139 (+) Transcript_8669:1-417(+)